MNSDFTSRRFIMMKHSILGIILSFSLLLLAACGGGDSTATPAKTSSTVKIGLSGTLGVDTIGGAEFTLALPANVTPAMTGTTVATSVVTPSGTFAGTTFAPNVTYTPAIGATPGRIKILVTSSTPTGVTTVGEIVTITLQLANGAAPAAADFPVSSVSVISHPAGIPIAGISASVTSVTLQ
jgi:hypothetical protein